MTSIQKIEKVEEILKNTGRLRRGELVDRLMKEGDMTKQVAYNAIDEAKELGKIKREERWKGKELMALYTVHFDIEEDEKNIFEFCERGLKQFDFRFDFFKDKFLRLTLEEKAVGLHAFSLLLVHLHVGVLTLLHNFGEANEWQTLLDDVNSRNKPLNDLMSSVPNEEQALIKRQFMEMKIDFINDVFIQLDEHLEKFRGR